MKKILLICSVLSAGTFTACEKQNLTNQGIENSSKRSDKEMDSMDSLKTGLIAYYPFNNNVKDESGNKHDGKKFNLTCTFDRNNHPNSAYYFNGISSYVKIKDSKDLRLANTSFSINYWVRLEGYNESHGSAVLHKRGGGSTNGWGTSITGASAAFTEVGKVGRAAYRVSGGNDPLSVGEQYLEEDKWYMITLSYNIDSQVFKIYVNGNIETTTPNIPSPNALASADLYLGRDSIFPEDSTPPYFLKGKLDDIRLYGRVLSQNQINNLLIIEN